MKCRVCSAQIPEGKKCCPRCGRVLTAADMNSQPNDEGAFNLSDKTMVYRPASSGSSKTTDKTININDIFSSDPNAPVYSDPHTYDRATADALEYDRMFMSRGNDPDADMKLFEPREYSKRQQKSEEEAPKPNSQRKQDLTAEPDYDDSEEIYEEDKSEEYPVRGFVIRDKKRAKPHFNFNIKYLIIALAVIAGLVVIVFGTYQLGKQFGIIGSTDEPKSDISNDSAATTTKRSENSSDIDNSYTAQTGVYTVYSEQNNIFVYKSVSDQRIIATIPNKTIIEISEINGSYGKTTYNSYTGWVDLDELKFTPNETPEQTTESTSGEATTLASYQPGTYTVTLNGSSTALNVRSTGSTSGEIVTTLSEGTQVTVEDVKSSWGKIYIDGIEGWVYMEYLK